MKNLTMLERRGWKRLKKSDTRTHGISDPCWEEPFSGRVMTETGATYREVHRYNCPHTTDQESTLAALLGELYKKPNL